jgi:hypothetical protein
MQESSVMATSHPTPLAPVEYSYNEIATRAAQSHAVSWQAIFAGATGAAVLSMVLLLLGTGIGFSSISPWSNADVSTTVGISTIIWLTVVQVLASAFGGYLAGRLRSKWASVHGHEVYFRDTAHGFLSWAVATLVTATLLSSAVGSVVSGSLKAGASVASGVATIASTGAAGASATNSAASGAPGSDPMGYFTDSMFRMSPQSSASANDAPTSIPTAEVGRIFTTGLKSGSLSATDSQYLAQLVSQRTGLSPEDAQKRVTDAFSRAQQSIQQAKDEARAAADKARKASAGLSLWLVVSLLIGALTASWAATFGGRLRDGVDAPTS